MKKRPEKKPAPRGRKDRTSERNKQVVLPTELYAQAAAQALAGDRDAARRAYGELSRAPLDARLQALIANDLAALAAADGDWATAQQALETSLTLDPACEPARRNLARLSQDLDGTLLQNGPIREPPNQVARIRVAIVSFLFNWPSTGGGIVHTVELAQFLGEAGYAVKHFYVRYPDWGVGRVEQPVPFASEALDFDEGSWSLARIQARVRTAVTAFDPDYVILTDSWNMKPLLAEAVSEFPYILRFQGMECLCPLNNVRLLAEGNGRYRQCHKHQLATPQECVRCLEERGHRSGDLHRAERQLSGVGTPEYHPRLLRVLRDAAAVLVVHPLQEAIFSPYTPCVRVATAGMDPKRFPWPPPAGPDSLRDGRLRILFAGLVDEWMKGYQVVQEACARLWQKRKDFELVATADPPAVIEPFTRHIGWQSQEALPRHLYAADVLVMPTIAQEALGRTAVEAMAAGKPVVASRIGGLPFTVVDGATGLLAEPGDADDLARKLSVLLDDAALRTRLGEAGRKRFEEHYAWPVIIERHYRPLLNQKRNRKA